MNPDDAERAFLFAVRTFAPIGYGRMMQIISHEWFRKDRMGAKLANTAYGLLPKNEREAYSRLAERDPVFRDDKEGQP